MSTAASSAWKWRLFWHRRPPSVPYSDCPSLQYDPQSTEGFSVEVVPLWIAWFSLSVLQSFSKVVFSALWFETFCLERQENLWPRVRLVPQQPSSFAPRISYATRVVFLWWGSKPTRVPIWPWHRGWSSLLGGHRRDIRQSHRQYRLAFERWLSWSSAASHL